MSENCNPFSEIEFIECQEYADRRSKLNIKDNRARSEFLVDNRKKNFLVKLKVDDCLIKTSDTRKCDFLILDCDNKIAYFIELKGKNLGDAINQIMSTIQELAPKLKHFQFRCRIVQTGVNGTTQPKYISKLVTYLKEKHKLNSNSKTEDLIKIKSREHTEII